MTYVRPFGPPAPRPIDAVGCLDGAETTFDRHVLSNDENGLPPYLALPKITEGLVKLLPIANRAQSGRQPTIGDEVGQILAPSLRRTGVEETNQLAQRA